MSPRHAETVQMPVAQADAITEKATLLRRAADLKHRLASAGDYDAAVVVAALIRAVRG